MALIVSAVSQTQRQMNRKAIATLAMLIAGGFALYSSGGAPRIVWIVIAALGGLYLFGTETRDHFAGPHYGPGGVLVESKSKKPAP